MMTHIHEAVRVRVQQIIARKEATAPNARRIKSSKTTPSVNNAEALTWAGSEKGT